MPLWQLYPKLADWVDWSCPVSAALQNGPQDFFYLFSLLIFIYFKPLSEVVSRLLVIQIQIQAVWNTYFESRKKEVQECTIVGSFIENYELIKASLIKANYLQDVMFQLKNEKWKSSRVATLAPWFSTKSLSVNSTFSIFVQTFCCSKRVVYGVTYPNIAL